MARVHSFFCLFVCVFVFSSLCLMYSCNSCATPFCSHSNCGIPDPSWAEIRHFVSFLNSQLRDCEQSFFCDMQLMRSVLAGPNVLNLEGFRSFVVRFMIQMSRVRYCTVCGITPRCDFLHADIVSTLMFPCN